MNHSFLSASGIFFRCSYGSMRIVKARMVKLFLSFLGFKQLANKNKIKNS